MRFVEFKQRVVAEFGENLHRATPDGLLTFASRLQAELSAQPAPDKHFELNESAKSYEEVLRQFFARVLQYPPDEAATVLWLTAIELAFGGLETPPDTTKTETTFSVVTPARGREDPPEGETWM
ncbi:MAG: hypothetical protein NZT92_07180 [Abditibacteriales bacterium]|nr:hypothetical protein [Abditibacteriales bacterium]MDW8365746.1 hypothetical protein [Abditibacteriales bacterium]